MRVRTYFFPGSFTRPPGTSTRNHPHEPTTSKPVVPMGVYVPSSIGTGAPPDKTSVSAVTRLRESTSAHGAHPTHAAGTRAGAAEGLCPDPGTRDAVSPGAPVRPGP